MASYAHRTRTDDRDEDRSRPPDRHERHGRHERYERDDARHRSRHGDERPDRHLDRHEPRHHRHHREDEHRSSRHRRTDRSRERERVSDGRDSARDRDRHRDKSKDDRKRHSHDCAVKDRPRHRSHHTDHTDPKSKPADAGTNSDTDALYTLDTRGDPLVRLYGTNDRASVPAYYRLFNGRTVLGSGQRFSFRQDGLKESFFAVPRFDTTAGSVLRDSSHPLVRRILQPTGRTKVREVQGAGNEGAASQPEDFVPVGSQRKRKRKRASDADSERGGSRGWPLPTLSSSGSSSDNSSDDDDDDDDDGDDSIDFVADHSALEATKQKLAQLSRQVREQPEDVAAWLALADLQEDQARLLGSSSSSSSTGDDSLAVAVGLVAPADDNTEPQTTTAASPEAAISAVKISIYESALRQVKRPADRDRLQLALLREAPRVWSRERIAKRWASLTERREASFAVWRARLDHEMTSLLSFHVDHVVDFCCQRLRLLEKRIDEEAEEAGGCADLYAEMVYVFLRATRLLYDAGFCDRATAAWQALLETTFARPAPEALASASASSDPGSSFEAFWDSEVPRIGDDKAEGWRTFAAKARSGQAVEDTDLDDFVSPRQVLPTVDVARIARDCRAEMGDAADVDEYPPLYRAWAVAERQRGALAKLPARVADEVDDDGYEDVFRVVMHGDIQSLLFTIPPALLPTVQPFLFDAFLLFCQLPPAFGVGPWIETARNDPFLAVICLATEEDKDDSDHAAAASGGRQPPDLGYDGSQVAVTADLLFPQRGWFRYLPRWLRDPAAAAAAATAATADDDDNGADGPPVPPRWVANVLRQLVRSFGVRDLALYSLAVDAAMDPAGVKRAARTLLKQYLSDTTLYNAYALAEASRGQVAVARSVLASAAASSTQDVEAELSLRQTWAWLEMEALQLHEALCRLVLGGEQSGSLLSPAQLLRARQTLRTGMDYSLSAGAVDRAALFAQSYVLLAYLDFARGGEQNERGALPTRGDVHAALAATAGFSDELQARGLGAAPAHERFLQGTARIVLFHACRGPYRPAELQTPLARFVRCFPRNGLFLRLFAWIDPAAVSGLSRLRPDDALQQMLGTVVLAPGADCPSSRAFGIRLALQKAPGADADADAGAGAQTTGPSRHAARAAFARAVGDGGFPGSASLWRAYVRLTVAEAVAAVVTVSSSTRTRADGDKDKDKDKDKKKGPRRVVTDKKLQALAKALYYRAVRACPWSKAVCLEGFGPLASATAMGGAADGTGASRPSLAAAELRAIVQQMGEMRLRLHVDPDAVRARAREEDRGMND